MRRIVVSVGLVALGTSGLQADTGSSLTSEASKPWSVSATLRGFYDDNINSVSPTVVRAASAAYGYPYHNSSFGFEVSPAITVAWPWEQTTLSLGYVYSFKDYQFRPVGNTDTVDMTHAFNVGLDHTFNELYQIRVSDAFVVGQEPDFLRAGNTYATYQRIPGNNIRNNGNATLDGKLTPLVGFEIGYANSIYDYAANQTVAIPFQASEAGMLNRMEQTIHLDSRWQFTPETVGILGYQFVDVSYAALSSNQQIAPAGPGSPGGGTLPYTSNSRNDYGHYAYVGIDQTFTPSLTGSFRVGARYTDYYNDSVASSEVSPYVQLSLRWNYGLESHADLGFVHDRSSTDLVGVGGASGLTMDAETSAIYATINHRLAPNLYGSLTGEFQDSSYNGGPYNTNTDDFYTFGANLEYRMSRNVSTQLGYNYDRLDSQIAGRSFDRNRVYLGVTASY
jgi:hypothetical protein